MGRIYDATWGRAFSALYDRAMKSTEEAGMREMRREALAEANGRTIDIGAGTGVNLELFPAGGERARPRRARPAHAQEASGEAPEAGREATVVQAPAEKLPFEDASFDTAVFTLVLCTVPDPAAALAEAARLLRPGGKLLFVEHVRSEEPGLARWQDRLEGPWHFLGDGCHCNRDTLATIEASPFEIETAEKASCRRRRRW